MYPPPSDRFLDALVESHRLVTVVELHRTGGGVQVLDHTGGSVTVDRGNAIRRTCSVTVPDTALIPMTPTDQLSIYGAKLRILRGVRHGDGTVETVPLGIFRVDELDGDPDTGPVAIKGSGLEAIIADDKFTAPYSTRGGTAAVTAITGIIQRSIPGAVVVNRASDATLGTRTWDKESDPWAAVQECAQAIGAECYCDPDGQFIIAELPDMLTAPIAWQVDAGPGGALISANRSFSREGMYNVVVASGENTEDNVAPVTATVADTDTSSPTYYLGPFGRVTKFHTSATLISTGQCIAAATVLLRAAVKPNASADITALPNPLLEPGDVIRVRYGSGDKELHQIQSFSIELAPGGDFTLATIGNREDS